MRQRDEFDGPDIKGAIASIFGVLDRRDRVKNRGPVWAGAIVVSLVAFLLSVLWYSYPKEAEQREIMAVPIIRADAGPIKVTPNDPGGMDIPHRDSTVFETLRAGRDVEGSTRQVENLLGDPEEPMTREQIFAGLRTELKVEGREVIKAPEQPVKKQIEAPAEVLDITEPVAVAKKEEPVSEEKTQQVAVVDLPVVPQAKPELDIATRVSRTEPAAGVETFEKTDGYFVQLASLRSNDAAELAWTDLTKSMAFLKPLGHKVQKADLGAKGLYYRLQAGPLTEARAREICAAVEAQRPGGCLVIKN